jgi:hypothetical protein
MNIIQGYKLIRTIKKMDEPVQMKEYSDYNSDACRYVLQRKDNSLQIIAHVTDEFEFGYAIRNNEKKSGISSKIIPEDMQKWQGSLMLGQMLYCVLEKKYKQQQKCN